MPAANDLAGLLSARRASLLKLAAYHAGRQDAEDVLQTAAIAAIEGLGKFEGRSSLYGWLCGIVRNYAIQAHHARRRTFQLTPLDAIGAVDARRSIEDELQARQDEEDAAAAIAMLDPRYREALVFQANKSYGSEGAWPYRNWAYRGKHMARRNLELLREARRQRRLAGEAL